MKKKGAVQLETVVIVVILLVFLLIMIFIYRNQIGAFAGKIFNLGNETTSHAEYCLKNPDDPKCQGGPSLFGEEQDTG